MIGGMKAAQLASAATTVNATKVNKTIECRAFNPSHILFVLLGNADGFEDYIDFDSSHDFTNLSVKTEQVEIHNSVE